VSVSASASGRQRHCPDEIYERRWALSVLDQVLARLGDEYRAAGPTSAGVFDQLQKSLTDEPDRLSPADAAREFGMTASAVRQASYRCVSVTAKFYAKKSPTP